MAYDLGTLFPYGPLYDKGKIVKWQVLTNPTAGIAKLIVSSNYPVPTTCPGCVPRGNGAFASDELFAIHGNHSGEQFANCYYTTGIGEYDDYLCPGSDVRPYGSILISNVYPGAKITLGLWNSFYAAGVAWGQGEIDWVITGYPPSTSSSTSSTSDSSLSLSSQSSSSYSSSTPSTSSSTSLSTGSSSSESTTSGIFPVYGVTYYSEFKDINAINNPLIDNSVQMQFKGYWEKDWLPTTLDFDKFGYGLKKTLNSQGSIYCNDASKLFSMNSGYVGMTISLPAPIINGVYKPLVNDSTEINEYFLWGVNIGHYEPLQPSLYATLTPRGIEFTVWTSAGKHTIIDDSTTIDANTDIYLEFLWDSDFISNYLVRTLIRVNNVNIASGNLPISDDSLYGLNFYVLNTPFSYNNFECTIRNLETYNTIPDYIKEEQFTSTSSSSISISSISTSTSSTEARSTSSSDTSVSNYDVIWTPRGNNYYYSDVAMSADGSRRTATVWDYLGGGGIYMSTNYGGTWTLTAPALNWNVIGMSANGGAQTAIRYIGTHGCELYVYDGGNWLGPKLTFPTSYIGQVAISADGLIQAVAVDFNGIYTSTDYGNNWTFRYPSTGYIIAMSSDGSILTSPAYNAQIMVSRDGGSTWNAKGVDNPWIGVAMSSDGKYQTATTLGGQIYVSNDYGDTWNAKATSRQWWRVAMSSDGRHQVALGDYGRVGPSPSHIFMSHDYGDTWDIITSPDTTSFYGHATGIAISADGMQLTVTPTLGKINTGVLV